MEHIMVFLIDMPAKIKGITIMNNDDSYTIFINARLNAEMQCATYDHEMEHINNKDYVHIFNVDDLETIRHVV